MPIDKRADKSAGGGAERRVHPRHEVAGVSGNFLFSTAGEILNLSLDGMALETSDYLQVGRSYSLKLQHESEELILRGRVVWCRMVRTAESEMGDRAPVYTAGIHFEDLKNETSREVHRFLGSNAVVSLEKRLFGRFRLYGAQTAGLDYEASFRVEKISLTGMQIKSDTFVEPETVLDLEIRLGSHAINTRGRVVHSQRLEPEPGVESASHLGIAFLEMDDVTQLAIKDLIRTALR